jgi:hypothetical protein
VTVVTPATRLSARVAVLESFGATTAVADELLAYDANGLTATAIDAHMHFPLDDEPCVEVWRRYADDVRRGGLGVLADRLVQLSFPIEAGISECGEYRAVTRRGEPRTAGVGGLTLERPHECEISIHRTWAGSIPVLLTASRRDFVSLVRAFTARNEPVAVPDSMGACFVAGYNNWDRLRRLRAAWARENPDVPFSFTRLSDRKDDYQDRFILLSDGWYSDVPPDALGLTADAWRARSVVVRREHESAHYWTRRVYGVMRSRVLDEIIADYCGIAAAFGGFRAEWLLLFLGLERGSACRDNGRLHNYRGDPPLSDAAFEVLQRLVRAAAAHLEMFARQHAEALAGERGALLALLTLTQLSLEELAAPDAPERLTTALLRTTVTAPLG